MDNKISNYLARCAKFEYILVCNKISLAKIVNSNKLQKVIGIEWSKLAALLETKYPFNTFNFNESGFNYLKEQFPQCLVIKDGHLGWDSDVFEINSWELFLVKSFAQLRNNIAHGNKSHLAASFTLERTDMFILAGNRFMNFIAKELLVDEHWEQPIFFN